MLEGLETREECIRSLVNIFPVEPWFAEKRLTYYENKIYNANIIT